MLYIYLHLSTFIHLIFNEYICIYTHVYTYIYVQIFTHKHTHTLITTIYYTNNHYLFLNINQPALLRMSLTLLLNRFRLGAFFTSAGKELNSSRPRKYREFPGPTHEHVKKKKKNS